MKNGESTSYTSTGIFVATVIGLVAGVVIGLITEYYTGMGNKPVNSIVRQSSTGAATNIIAGLGVGMMSTLWPTIINRILYHRCVSYFGGTLRYRYRSRWVCFPTLGIQLAVDAYGPISDNAGGIAEMACAPPKKFAHAPISWMQ